ncbi:MAG: hypothetical protein KDA90_07885 [Planctomycetaceae bacterium]|nr:hypothetical protein [Planctomycetaceae bacterium]
MADNNTAVAVASEKKETTGQPARWLGRFFLLGLLALSAVGWFLPAIVGRAWSQTDVLEILAPNMPATVQFDRAQLSWQSPVLLRDVKVNDRKGHLSANIGAVTTGQTLWQLVSNRAQPLTLEFEGLVSNVIVPTLHPSPQSLSLQDPKEHIEHFLKLLLTKQIPGLPRATSVHLSGSRLTFVDSDKRVLTVLSDISGTYAYHPGDAAVPASHKWEFDGKVEQPATQGRIQTQGEWQAAGGKLSPEAEILKFAAEDEKLLARLTLDRLPLDSLQPLTSESLGGQLLTGALSGEATLAVSRSPKGAIQTLAKGELRRPAEPQVELLPMLQRPDGTTVPVDLDPLTWTLQANYVREQDLLNVPQLAFSSVPFGIQGQGQIEGVNQLAVVDVAGQLRCDAQGLFDQLPQELREQLQVQGLRVAEFSAKGPLRTAPTENAEAAPPGNAFQLATLLTWDQIKAFGLVSDEGKLRASVDEGVLLLDPVHFPVNQGQVRQLPRIVLNSDPLQFQLNQGALLERVALTEDLVRSWLKYLSPAMANSTSIEGTLSLAVSKPVTASIGNLETADIPGVLTIHRAKIGPGPMIRQMLTAIDQIRLVVDPRNALNELATVTMDEQQVAFRLVEGRIYHKDFGLNIGDVRVSTTGSVGLDETVDLVLSIPLNAKWLKQGPILQSLQGEVITLNIRGTLNEPQMDLRPLGEFGKRIGIKAAGGLLQRILEGKRRGQ